MGEYGKPSPRKKRNAWLKDVRKDANGKWVYVGTKYAFQGDKTQRKAAMLTLLGLALLATACMVGCGLIPAPGMKSCAYVLIPYMVGLLTAFGMLWQMIQLLIEGDPLPEYAFEGMKKKYPVFTTLTCLMTCLVLAGEVVVLLTIGTEDISNGYTAMFLGMDVISFAAAFLSRKIYSSIQWKKED